MARRQKYKFAKQEHAQNGRLSTGIAVVSLVLLLFSVILSFAFGGQAGVYVGAVGLMSMLFSLVGFFTGVKGYSEKDCSHKLCTVGVIANGLIAIIYLALISMGAA